MKLIYWIEKIIFPLHMHKDEHVQAKSTAFCTCIYACINVL